MTAPVPPLEAKPPGPALRTLGLVVPGIRKVSAQIKPYTAWWSEQNQRSVEADGPLLVLVGDSTAIGIGASAPDRGYASLVVGALSSRDDVGWRAINLAQSGARTADGLDRQLPILSEVSQRTEVDLVICCLGTNDVVWSTDVAGLRRRLTRLVEGLGTVSADYGAEAIVAPVAGGSPRARAANRAIAQAAGALDIPVVDPWREPGPGPAQRLAEDRFHPNDLGYRLMARPFARALGAPQPVIEQQGP
jgi:lysophospholipase L1-like esterase